MKRFLNILVYFLLSFSFLTIQTDVLANSLKIISEESSEIVFLYETPSYSVVKEFDENGSECSRILIPDTVDLYEPGKPVLPKKSFLIAIPDNANLQIRILDKEFKELREIKMSLQKKSELRDFDDVFSSNTLSYPPKLIEVEDTAFVRNQKVARISIYPVFYSPQNSIVKLAKTIKFKVSFVKERGSSRKAGKKADGIPRGRNPLFDNLIRKSVINEYVPGNDSGKSSSKASFKKRRPSEFILKIKTKGKGIYIITYQDFKKMQYVPESINPLNLRVFHKDVEVPVYIEGEDDGEFNKSDFMIFYADEVDSGYTSYNQFFLKYGSTAGLRIKEKNGIPADMENSIEEFNNDMHFEENNQYKKYSFDQNADHWYWVQINSGEKKIIPFTISNLIQKGDNASIKINLTGLTYSLPEFKNANHHAKISVNGGISLGDSYFKGQEKSVAEYVISDTNLYDGVNYLTLENPGDTDAPNYVDIFLLDSFDIKFAQKLTAVKDKLIFSSEGTGGEKFGISGFSNSNIRVFNITDKNSPEIITGTVITSYIDLDLDRYSKYKVFFSDLSEGQKSFCALSYDKFKKPLNIVIAGKDNLKSETNGADYLVITHDKFFDAVKPLIKFRKKAGLKAKAVKVSDIYDEFGYGIHDPQAIKDFLKYTYQNWEPVPAFVLLVGDTIIDYKNYLNYGRKSYIPTKILNSPRFKAEYASDSWFVEVNGDDTLPDMFIGRIPANSADEVVNAVKKIKHYEKSEYGKDWQKRIVLVADDNESDYEISLNDLSKNIIPSDFGIKKYYISNYKSGDNCNDGDCPAVRDGIISDINKGNLIIVYSGHGNTNNWAGEKVLQSSDMDSFKGRKNTFVIALNCNNGDFVRLGEDHSFGEKIVMVPKSGGIASFVNSGNGYSVEQDVLMDNLFKNLFDGYENQLGFITTQAKISGYSDGFSDEVIRFFILFGDPAVRLKLNSERIILKAPLNGYKISKLTEKFLLFSWQAPSEFKFRIQFSKDEKFSEQYDFKIPDGRWIKVNNKAIRTKKINTIKKMIGDNSGELFWRIKGRSGSGVDKKIILSESRKLR